MKNLENKDRWWIKYRPLGIFAGCLMLIIVFPLWFLAGKVEESYMYIFHGKVWDRINGGYKPKERNKD